MKHLWLTGCFLVLTVPALAFLTGNAIYVEPVTPPSLPSAGSLATDPTFGTQILRLTDSGDSAGDCNTGYSNQPAFNVNNTKVRAICTVGSHRLKVWDFNPSTMVRSNGRIQANPPSGAQQEYHAQWSRTVYNKFYVVNNRVIYEVTIPDGGSTTWTNVTIRDFAAELPAVDHITQFSMSSDNDVFAFHYVTAGVSNGYMAYKRSTNTILLNVSNEGTIDEVEIDKSGRYLVSLKNSGALHVWDLQGTPTRTTVTADVFNHRGMGNGVVVSHCASRRLCIRNLATPNSVTYLLPAESWVYGDSQDHFSMTGPDGWMLGCRYKTNAQVVTAAYNNECTQISTTGNQAVRRIVHNRANVWSSDGDASARGSLSIDGQFLAWTSNWEGANAGVRNDVYIGKIQASEVDNIAPTVKVAQVSASGAGQATVTWTASFDAIGVTGYTIRRCTGAACTPTATLTALGNVLTFTNTGLASGTTYGYAVNARDAAGNESAYSATVYVTTTATFRTTLALDDFNRANGLLGPNWDDGYTALAAFELVSNQLRVATVGTNSNETYNAVATPNDQWCQVTILTVNGSGGRAPGCIVRAANQPTNTSYGCRPILSAGSNIRRDLDGVGAILVSETSSAWLAGDKLRCEIEGTTLRSYQIRGQSDTLLLSVTDANIASGRTGMAMFVAAGTTADVQIDDFVMGGFSATPPVLPSIVSVDATNTQATVVSAGSPTFIRVETATVSLVEPIAQFPGNLYTYPASIVNSLTDSICFYARDLVGTENPTGVCDTTITIPDTTPPIMSGVSPSTPLPETTTSAVIAFVTNEIAACRYDTVDTTYALMTLLTIDASLTHSFTATGLTPGSTNTFYAHCIDAAGNITQTSLTIVVTVAASTADVTLPSTVVNLVCTTISATQAECVWSAATDNVAIAGYQVYLCSEVGCSNYALVGVPVPATEIVVALAVNTSYTFVVRAIDTSNNYSAADSLPSTMVTSGIIDHAPPTAMAGLTAVAYSRSVRLTWQPGSDNTGVVFSVIEQSPSGCGAFAVVNTNISGTQLVRALAPSTTYCFRGKHSDIAGNVSELYSNMVIVTTAAGGLEQPRRPLTQPRQPLTQPRRPLTQPRAPRVP